MFPIVTRQSTQVLVEEAHRPGHSDQHPSDFVGNAAGEPGSGISLFIINNSTTDLIQGKRRSRQPTSLPKLYQAVPKDDPFETTLRWTIFARCFEIFHKDLKRYKTFVERQLYLWRRMSLPFTLGHIFHPPTGTPLTLTKLGHFLTRAQDCCRCAGALAERARGWKVPSQVRHEENKKQPLVWALVVHAVLLEATASAWLPGAQTGHSEQTCQGIQLRNILTQDTTRKTNPKVTKSE